MMVTWVRNSELHLAHKRWMEVWPWPLDCDWSHFVGETIFPPMGEASDGEAMWAINDKGAARIRLIAKSPHYRALLLTMAVHYKDKEK